MVDCIFSVIFPNNIQYFDDYCSALLRQSKKDFVIFLCNDGVKDLPSILLNYPELKFQILEVQGSIPAVREWAIKELIKTSFVNIHFLDTDDYVSPNYIELKSNMLKYHEVVCNDLHIIDQHGTLIKPGKLSSRLIDGFTVTQDFLLNKNILGMSNTSVRRDILIPISIPENLVAVDWYVFFRFLKNKSALFTNQVHTYYRQHGANTLGDVIVTEKAILLKINAMISHANALVGEYPIFQNMLQALHNLQRDFENEPEILFLAQKKLSNAEIDYFWFEDISLLLNND